MQDYVNVQTASYMWSGRVPGCVAKCQIWVTELGASSSGAWRMITVEPTIHSTQPSTHILCSFSFRVKWARTALQRKKPHMCRNKNQIKSRVRHLQQSREWSFSNYKSYLTIMLSAPRGVTRTAGANMYATKFAISPISTAKFHIWLKHLNSLELEDWEWPNQRNQELTRNHPNPPEGLQEVSVASNTCNSVANTKFSIVCLGRRRNGSHTCAFPTSFVG
jgi:hypothetical protein